MSINKIMMSIVIISLVVLGVARADILKSPVTIEQYVGVWYDVAVLFPKLRDPNPISCQWRNVTRRDDDAASFNEVFVSVNDGEREKFEGRGTLVNSELNITYYDTEEGTSVYGVTSYNNGIQMILYDESDPMYSVLISRDRSNTTISAEAGKDFKDIVLEVGGYVHYIDNQNCN